MAADKLPAKRTTRTPQRARSKAQEQRTANRDWVPDFLRELARYGIVQWACDAAQVGRSTVYELRQSDAAFAASWNEAREVAWDRLEQEAYRRAAEGVDVPLVSGGRVVRDDDGEIIYVKQFSDQLMSLMLRAKRPGEYRDRQEIQHSGSVSLTLSTLAQKAAEFRASQRELEE